MHCEFSVESTIYNFNALFSAAGIKIQIGIPLIIEMLLALIQQKTDLHPVEKSSFKKPGAFRLIFHASEREILHLSCG
jgi:hypothetical protein